MIGNRSHNQLGARTKPRTRRLIACGFADASRNGDRASSTNPWARSQLGRAFGGPLSKVAWIWAINPARDGSRKQPRLPATGGTSSGTDAAYGNTLAARAHFDFGR